MILYLHDVLKLVCVNMVCLIYGTSRLNMMLCFREKERSFCSNPAHFSRNRSHKMQTTYLNFSNSHILKETGKLVLIT